MRTFSNYGLSVINTLNKTEQRKIFKMLKDETIDTTDYRVSKNRVIEFYISYEDNLIDVNMFNSVEDYLSNYGREGEKAPKKL
jgi:hypothetical protein